MSKNARLVSRGTRLERTTYIGVDPGGSGGWAALDANGSLVEAYPMPDITGTGLLEMARTIGLGTGGSSRRVAMLERVWSSPGWGHSGAFTFGGYYHGARLALMAAGITFYDILPGAWQASIGVDYPKGAKSTAKKNITKGIAEKLFPGVEITHALADALLIAEFCRRYHEGRGRRG